MFKLSKKYKSAFTLIELLVVVAIIGIITTITVVSLNVSRARARDAKRVSDIKQIQTALELYYSNYEEYPATLGDSIASGTKIYLADVPTAPTPADGDCSDSDNSYTYEVQGTTSASYSISFCLGSSVGEISAGVNSAIPGEITSTTYAWQPVGTAGFSTGMAFYSFINLIFYNGTPYISFTNLINDATVWNATVMKYNGSTWENVGNPASGTDAYTALVIDNEDFYVSYLDIADNENHKFTVKKLNGDTWELFGLTLSLNYADYIPFTVYNGIPYIAYTDTNNNNKSTVKKYSGSAWETVGGTEFLSTGSSITSLVIDNEIPYIAALDANNEYKAIVKKFDGNNWIDVGNPWFSSGIAEPEGYFISLAFYNGIPYVAYLDYSKDYDVTVKKLNGDTWESVGEDGLSGGRVSFLALTIYNGTPYVVYADSNYKVTVKKFNGTDWVGVGNPEFSVGAAYFPDIAIYNGIPYVAYSDEANGNKATVMKYDAN